MQDGLKIRSSCSRILGSSRAYTRLEGKMGDWYLAKDDSLL